MPVSVLESSIGEAVLPDVGTLTYNGVTFSSLYKSTVSGMAVPDAAGRTIRYVEITIQVDAIVTLSAGQRTTDVNLGNLRNRLETYGGALSYTGKGFGTLNVNTPGGSVRDVAWGPKVKLLDFQPLGGARAAAVRWQVTTCVPELAMIPSGTRMVQFNYAANVSYDELCYSKLSLEGTLELPLTRKTVSDRDIPDCVDNFRQRFLDITIDLEHFRVTHREFRISRDKRTSEWSYEAEEIPRMGLPPEIPVARGEFSVRPMRPGAAIVSWLCTLRATYSVRSDRAARHAWWAFLQLWKFRMNSSAEGTVTVNANPAAAAQQPPVNAAVPLSAVSPAFGVGVLLGKGILAISRRFREQQQKQPSNLPDQKAIPVSFSFSEGLYLDSKTMTFEASWTLITNFTHLLLATGVWRWMGNTLGGNVWSQSVQDVMGFKGYLVNRVDPNAEVIVDMGGSADALTSSPFVTEAP